MEFIEIIVFLFVAILVGGMVLVMVSSTDERAVEEAFMDVLDKEDSQGFAQMSINRSYGAILLALDACRLDDSFVRTIVVEEEGVVSKESFFSLVKRASLCRDVQSVSLGCGSREDVNSFVIDTPAIITFSCEEQTLKIE